MNDATHDIETLSSAPILLVASDFDGTLAELAPTPDAVRPNAEALEALRVLGALPRTFTAVISGRALADLSTHLPDEPDLKLFGSHGGEGSWRLTPLTDEQERTLTELSKGCASVAEQFKGAMIETKPFSVAIHYRAVERASVPAILDEIRALSDRFPIATKLQGIEVIEFLVLDVNKGRCLKWLTFHVGAARAVFLGDDVTDESAFSVLRPQDLGFKVGAGESAANRRLADPTAVAGFLTSLAAARKRFLHQQRPIPIQNHAIIADQRTVGIVAPDASIQWLCLPRLDSPSVFGALLGDDSHGVFRVSPQNPSAPPRQEYVGDSLIVRTTWPEAEVVDYFDCGEGRPFQRAGRTDLMRVITARSPVLVQFSPRMGYGNTPAEFALRPSGLEISDWADPACVYSPDVQWSIEQTPSGPIASALLPARERPYLIEFRYGTALLRPAENESACRARTTQYWSAWAGSLKLPRVHPQAVKRSALTLRALLHGPTGAIAAAATTSLPAPLGGERNWDYRYCWPRDACLAAQALLRLGNIGMPMKLLDWLCDVVSDLDSPDHLRPIYSLSGRELGSEGTLPQMPGYLHSAPVRIGNAAADQVQLDVFGPIVDTIAKLAEAGAPVTPEYWRLAGAMAQAVKARWQEPDHGIWELRTPKRFHTHSRVMCWLALHRASTVAEQVVGSRHAEWDDLAETVRKDTLARAWNPDQKYFSAHLNGTELDAAVLVMGLTGFIEPTDERFVATVHAIHRELMEGDVLHRYFYEDGLPGIDGGFLLCTAWLIEAFVLIGRTETAQAMFESYLKLQGPTGLLAEQWDPKHGAAMGNFPQAYSHVGLINCACVISERLGAARSG